MRLILTDYELKKIPTNGKGKKAGDGHRYLLGSTIINNVESEILVYCENSMEEKKLFNKCTIELEGDLIESKSESPHNLVQAKIFSVRLNNDLPHDNLSIHDRLMATGLIHEFKECYRKDKIRAREILKLLGVSEEYAEDVLLKKSNILPFI